MISIQFAPFCEYNAFGFFLVVLLISLFFRNPLNNRINLYMCLELFTAIITAVGLGSKRHDKHSKKPLKMNCRPD